MADDKKIDYRSLRATLATKERNNLWDVAATLYKYDGPKSVGKERLVEFLEEAIPSDPDCIAACFPPIDRTVGEALWNAFRWGSARIAFPGSNHRKLLRQVFFLGVERDGDDLVIHVPDEIRVMYEDDDVREFWEEQRDINDAVDDIAEACVRRYGHVTVNAILDLCVRWHDMPKTQEIKTAIKRVLGGRSSMCLGMAEYYLLGDAVLHLSICGKDFKDLGRLGPTLVNERKRYPRWMPKCEEDFLEVIKPNYYEKTPATHRLIDFLADVLEMDTEEADEFLVDLNEELMGGERLEVAFDLLAEHGGLCPKGEEEHFRTAIRAFAGDVRLRWLNGHSSAEVGKEYEPLPPDRVFHAGDVDEASLHFPNFTPEEIHSPEFDNLEVEDEPIVEDEPVEGDGPKDERSAEDADPRFFEYDDQETYVRETLRIGRNDPCPCGSGKKYKKCCGKGK